MAEELQNPKQPKLSYGKIGQFIKEHRIGVLIGVRVTVVVGFVLYMASNSSGMSTTTTTATSPQGLTSDDQDSLATTGYQTQGVAYGLDQLARQLNAMQQQLKTLQTTPGPTGPPEPTPPSGAPAGSGPPGPSGQPGNQSYTNPPGIINGKVQQLPVGSVAWTGTGGRIWFGTPGGTQQLLTGPQGASYLGPNWNIIGGAQGRVWAEPMGTNAEQLLIPTLNPSGIIGNNHQAYSPPPGSDVIP
jgi:hypothetical protein